MSGLPRACLVCGRRVVGGAARCPDHAEQRYRTPVGCYVCGRRGPKGYCPAHDPWTGDKPEHLRLQRQPWRAGYQTASYRIARKIALQRAGGYCERCGRSDLPLEADHIVPLSTAKSELDCDRLNTPENLAILCTACHRRKTHG
jgi:5-methylcytosine-specific restriction endonuclease McrA